MESKGAKMVLGVYDHFKQGVEKPQVKHWDLVAISPTAGVWKNDKSKSYAYAYRGMLTAEDTKVVPTLVSSKVSSTARYQKDKAFTKKHQPPQGYKRYAFGHSLGGAIVDQILADGLADTAITYNPAIELSKLNNQGNRRRYNRHDFLYKLIGMYASNVETVNNDFFSKISAGLNFINVAKSLYEHNISQFIDKDKELLKKTNEVAPKEEKEENDEKAGHPKSRSYLIQSVILHKTAFPTLEKAKEWASLHKYKTDKHDETLNEYRFRQISPDIFKTGMYEAKNIELKDTGYLVVAYKL